MIAGEASREGHGVGGPGTNKKATSVEDMFQQMLSKMSTVTETVSGVKEEVAQIRENMVPRSEFMAHMEDMKAFKHEVDTKFANLSVSGSSGDGGTASLKQAIAKQARALDRLDVAHKSVCMDGFALDMSASARSQKLKSLCSSISQAHQLPRQNPFLQEHVAAGAFLRRQLLSSSRRFHAIVCCQTCRLSSYSSIVQVSSFQ